MSQIGKSFLLVSALIACHPLAASPAAAADQIVILAGRVLDPESGNYSGPSAIIIRGGRIAEIKARAQFTRQSTDSVIDLGNLTVLPGLIDAHVHLAIGGPVRKNAEADLAAGFTTVVDLGSLTNRMLSIRDSINAGLITGPRVLAAGRWIGRKNGVCEFNGLGIDGGASAFRQRAAENAESGADVIKLCLSGWPATSHANPDEVEIPDSTIAAVVDESHRRGKMVIAHALSRGSVAAALRTGVDGLAHSAFVDRALATEMARRNVFMISTIVSLTGGDTSIVARDLVKSLVTAKDARVTLVFGTDGGVLPHGKNADELEGLVRAGFTELEAIRMATTTAARALKIQDSIGSVRAGMSADLIAVDGDPLKNISILKAPKLVMLRGRAVPLVQ